MGSFGTEGSLVLSNIIKSLKEFCHSKYKIDKWPNLKFNKVVA